MGKINSLDMGTAPKRRSFFAGNVDTITSAAEKVTPDLRETLPIDLAVTDISKDIKGQIIQIHLDSLGVYEYQSRKNFDEDKLKELSQSIRVNGIRNPLKVIQRGSKFEVVSGERRLRAARLAGIDHAPCIIIEDRQAIIESVLENLQRENLNIFEEGRDYIKLMDCGIYQNQKEIADGLGVSMSRISEVVGFYKRISSEDQDKLLKTGKVSRQQLRDFIDDRGPSVPSNKSFQISIALKSGTVQSKMINEETLDMDEKGIIIRELNKLLARFAG